MFEGVPTASEELPPAVDLREFFPSVHDQQTVHGCTAHACVALVEYFERRALGATPRLSARFLHQVAAEIGKSRGMQGNDLRTHLQAMTTFGAPPARLWPWKTKGFDLPPGPQLYGYAQQFSDIYYLKLDRRNQTGTVALHLVRSFLAAGIPLAFGFAVPGIMDDDGTIPYFRSSQNASVLGGQTVVAVGYDDRRRTGGQGAVLVRSSWGSGWGEQGHGWLPYAYVEEQLAVCFWAIVSRKWLLSGEFGRPMTV